MATQIDGQSVSIKRKSRNPVIEFDKLQLYFRKPYAINLESAEGRIEVYQPTIGDIMELGETKFYSTINSFITNTTSYRLFLWDAGIDWNELSDFQLFTMLVGTADAEVTNLIFKGVDFSKFKPFTKTLNGEESLVLYDEENHIEINEEVYWHMSQYLRTVLNIFPEEKLTKNKFMKETYISKDRRMQERQAELQKENQSSLLTLISSCVNHPGFKYNVEQLKDVGIYQFYDSVKRLQVYESATACMSGMYSGFCDSSKIPAESYNFMKEL